MQNINRAALLVGCRNYGSIDPSAQKASSQEGASSKERCVLFIYSGVRSVLLQGASSKKPLQDGTERSRQLVVNLSFCPNGSPCNAPSTNVNLGKKCKLTVNRLNGP